jgi:hypothetical protein
MNTDKELKNYFDFLTKYNDLDRRRAQAKSVNECLEKYFDFDYIECIETGASQDKQDGCFGLFLAEVTKNNNGTYSSVDNNLETINKSKEFYNEFVPNFNINHYCEDSVKFLSEYKGKPNLVHLDSWDLNLKNPVPSMLHGWLEFEAIKDKMPIGSICVIDDNFLKNTWINWQLRKDGEYIGEEKITIKYDIIGKGSLIYHWCEQYDTNWELIGDHYQPGENIKIIIRKKS